MNKCYCCEKELDDTCIDNSSNEYILKTGDKVEVCFMCENDDLIYIKIKEDCLIDGESYELTKSDKKYKKQLQSHRSKELNDEKEWDNLIDGNQKVYWFSNRSDTDFNLHSALSYANEFCSGNPDNNEDSIKRFKYNYIVDGVEDVTLDNVFGLKWVKLILDNVKIEDQKVKKPDEKEWRNRQRKWYSGRVICSEDFYNVTFGFSRYSDEDKFGEVYMGYKFICSKSWQIKELVEKYIVIQL